MVAVQFVASSMARERCNRLGREPLGPLSLLLHMVRCGALHLRGPCWFECLTLCRLCGTWAHYADLHMAQPDVPVSKTGHIHLVVSLALVEFQFAVGVGVGSLWVALLCPHRRLTLMRPFGNGIGNGIGLTVSY
jgi:hypothetical protein